MRRADKIRFRLFVAGSSPHSVLAVENLRRLCQEHLPDRHEIEIVDVLRTPGAALENGVFVTPTLVRVALSPAARMIGNLSQRDAVLAAMGLADSRR